MALVDFIIGAESAGNPLALMVIRLCRTTHRIPRLSVAGQTRMGNH